MRVEFKRSYEGYKTLWGGNGEVGASVGSVRVLIVVMGWILFGMGSMQRVKVTDKVLTNITLFCSDRGYYPYSVDLYVLWILSAYSGSPRSVDIICI